MNTFEQLSLNPEISERFAGSRPLYGVPLPNLFGTDVYDMPLTLEDIPSGEFVLEEAGDASQPVVYEEVIDFFIDSADPNNVVIFRSAAAPPPSPCTSSSSMSSTPIAPSPLPGSVLAEAPSARKRPRSPAAPCFEDGRLAVKRERNRQAAERCRARRVNLITNLQTECDQLRAEKDRLLRENRALMEALVQSGYSIAPLQQCAQQSMSN